MKAKLTLIEYLNGAKIVSYHIAISIHFGGLFFVGVVSLVFFSLSDTIVCLLAFN